MTTHTQREYLRRDLIMLLLNMAPRGAHEAYANQAEFRNSIDYMVLTLEPLLKVMYDSSQEAAQKRALILSQLSNYKGDFFPPLMEDRIKIRTIPPIDFSQPLKKEATRERSDSTRSGSERKGKRPDHSWKGSSRGESSRQRRS